MTSASAIPSLDGSSSAVVHPVVLFTVADAFTRRAAGMNRVIGTLLGSAKGGKVEVRQCYTVPHSETNEQVMLDIDYHTVMLDMHRKCSPGDEVVGWFSSGEGEFSSDALIQEFYSGIAPDGVHLMVDMSLEGGKMAVRCFKSHSLVLNEEQLACGFVEVPAKVRMEEAERVGTELLKRGTSEGLPSDMSGLEESVKRLQRMVDTVSEYVDGVCAGRIEPNSEVGRKLAATLDAVPRLGSEGFDKLYTDSMQDVLLSQYLSKLVSAQLALAEKLVPDTTEDKPKP